MQLTFCFLSAIDTASPPHSIVQAHAQWQTELMLRVLHQNFRDSLTQSDNAPPTLWLYLRGQEAQDLDPCTWTTVDCTDGIARAFIFTWVYEYPNHNEQIQHFWSVDVEWLPSTLQYIHINGAKLVNDWKPELLPRETRYFYLLCRTGRAHKNVKLENLPLNIEELHLRSANHGTVVIANLPPKMRFCTFQCTGLYHAHVHSPSLPDSLELITIGGIIHKVKCRELSGGVLDERVHETQSYMDHLTEQHGKFVKKTNEMVYVTREVERAHKNTAS